MKIFPLFAYLAIFVLFAAMVWQQLKPATRKPSRRSLQRAGVRPFTRLERFALLFVVPMAILSTWVHRMRGDNRIVLANYIAQPGGKEDSKLADGVIARRSLIKLGSDENHIAATGTADIPIGITRDGSAAAAGVYVSFAQLGLYDREVEGVASGAISYGDFLIAGPTVNGCGTVRSLALAGVGTWYIIGRAKQTVTDTLPVVFLPMFPIQRVQ